ncbi:MAG TPA: TolC family protein [Terriglobales bacterium]|nr:TolC family protein [Terriglobales bacterium]
MKLRLVLPILLSVAMGILQAQTVRERETFRGLSNPQALSDTLPGPRYMSEHVVDGKLRLTLQDAVVLTLANNSNVRITELNVETAKYGVLRMHQPFDPLAQASFSTLRSTSPTFSDLAGAQTLSTLNQITQINYSQNFESGTNFQVGFSASKLSSNSTFNFFNPSLTSSLNLQFTQPLLRSRWLFANRAPLMIARHNLRQSRANFEAQVSDAILQVVSQYWGTVQARGNLEVARKSMEAAEASYQRDKRALELGALPPLDIYRSESQVASRRVQVIQGEYALKQAEDALRLTIGADLDPYFRALDLDLTEKAEPEGELRNVDASTALQQALDRRPEFEALRQLRATDDISVRLAHNNLLPDLRLSGNYSSNGLGGNQIDTSVSPPRLIPGGFGDSLNQLFGFGFPTYGFTLSLNLPIRNRGAQADLGNALVSRRRDLYTERLLREQITLEVANAVHLLEQASLTVAASKQALDLAQKNLAAEQRKHQLGSETIFFVLEAQTELAQAETGLLQAQVSYQLAVAAVDHATGRLLDPYRVTITDLTK